MPCRVHWCVETFVRILKGTVLIDQNCREGKVTHRNYFLAGKKTSHVSMIYDFQLQEG